MVSLSKTVHEMWRDHSRQKKDWDGEQNLKRENKQYRGVFIK